jgi:hypothetical protein
MKWRCKRCGVKVTMNLDHVGPDCDHGECSGTFEHPSEVRCDAAGDELQHDEVKVR